MNDPMTFTFTGKSHIMWQFEYWIFNLLNHGNPACLLLFYNKCGWLIYGASHDPFSTRMSLETWDVQARYKYFNIGVNHIQNNNKKIFTIFSLSSFLSLFQVFQSKTNSSIWRLICPGENEQTWTFYQLWTTSFEVSPDIRQENNNEMLKRTCQ